MARPREFDVDEVLDAALDAFWAHGFEATSMTDLIEVTGLQKGSLYKAFGSKHALFLTALQRYLDQHLLQLSTVFEQARTPTDGIRTWLNEGRKQMRCGSVRKGCLAINSIVECAPHDTAVQACLAKHYRRLEDLLAGVVRAGQRSGEFRDDLRPRQLARFLAVFGIGMVVSTKGCFPGLERENLTNVALSTLVAG